MKSTALYLTLWYQKYLPKGILIKIFFMALLGSFIEIVGLLSGVEYHSFIGFVHLVEVPSMMLFLAGKERKYLVKMIVTGYFFILFINGIQELFWNMFGENGNFHFFLILSCSLAVLIVKRVYGTIKIEQYIYVVELQNKEKCCQVRGFYDTGNRLREPYGQKSVHILSKDICEKILSDSDTKLLVPYHALGNTDGLLEVVYIERMKVRKGEKLFEFTDIAIGKGEKQLFEGKEYDMILNESIFL